MLICEGKTKRIVKADREGEVFLETKDDLTGGDAAKKETIRGISRHKTRQTRHVFELLKKHGIPTAYVGPENESTLRCLDCDMLPLELVMRRYAWGSYLKREPGLVSTAEKPHRFDSILTEFFHKHAVVGPPNVATCVQMEEGKARDRYLKNGAWADGVFTDPLIRIRDGHWFLHSAKLPVDEKKPLMETPALLNPQAVQSLISDIMIPVFETLEKAWAGITTSDGPVALVDIKIECGRSKKDGRLVVADVIDNDSWRIWPGANPRRQLDKQCFRDGDALSSVAEKYELVSRLTDRFL